jgi:hypothetical protein
MAGEAQITTSLVIRKGNLLYISQPQAFVGNVNSNLPNIGPVPGQLIAGVGGVNINFGAVTTPGYGTIQNLDTVNTIHVGIFIAGSTNRFFPLFEVQPGEIYPFRISRHLLVDYPATGTGSPEPAASLHVRADVAPCAFVLNVFQT